MGVGPGDQRAVLGEAPFAPAQGGLVEARRGGVVVDGLRAAQAEVGEVLEHGVGGVHAKESERVEAVNVAGRAPGRVPARYARVCETSSISGARPSSRP